MNKHLYLYVPIANPVPLETLPNQKPIAQTSDGGRKQVPALGLTTSPECPWAHLRWEGYRAGYTAEFSIQSTPSLNILPATASVDRATAASHWYVLEEHIT
jgi:hypothetical protein